MAIILSEIKVETGTLGERPNYYLENRKRAGVARHAVKVACILRLFAAVFKAKRRFFAVFNGIIFKRYFKPSLLTQLSI